MNNIPNLDPWGIYNENGKQVGKRPHPITDEESAWEKEHIYTKEERENDDAFQQWLDSLSKEEAQQLFDMMDASDERRRQDFLKKTGVDTNTPRPHVLFALVRYKKKRREEFYYNRIEDIKEDYENSIRERYSYVGINRLNRDYTVETLQNHIVNWGRKKNDTAK